MISDELARKIICILKEHPSSVKNINTKLFGRKKFKDRTATSPQIWAVLRKLMKEGRVDKTLLGRKFRLVK